MAPVRVMVMVGVALTMMACGGNGVPPPDAARMDARSADAPPITGWREVPFQPIPARPFLCVQGVGGEVFFSGGSIGTGKGSLALRFDGQWHELDLQVEETLWWLWPRARDDVWFVGEKGIAVHWDGTRAMTTRLGTDATLFGVWGAGDEVWAVGGSPTSMGDNDLLYHFDGTAWTKVAPPAALGVAYLKVWGSGPRDVFVVGRQGVIVHYDGQRWARQESGSQAILTTVHGTGPRDVWAVGGPPAVVLHYDGTGWSPQAGGLGWRSAAASGVWAEADGTVWVVGWGGEAWRRKSGTWVDETPATFAQDLHVVWADGLGNAFAGGGSFLAPASATLVRRGFLGRYGSAVPAGTVSTP